ncbi:hypothetical protein HELRODRAFT_136060, partial [Helobdella robusta]|uniref:Macro domain-containing protein n=1 Tax=Helobdella robusta TaxID=6412 RepID=T1EIB7_HELRO
IQLILGSILESNADVIVNAANSRLQHNGGVAHAISMAAGTDVQAECSSYVKQHGEVSTSDVYISGPGRLKFKAIIHAVGPIYRAQTNANTLLCNTISNIMKCCEGRKWSNVALPAISTGIFSFP